MRTITLITLLTLSLSTTRTVFSAGESGYAQFRIPSLVEVNGALIAFAEGRVDSLSDFGDIDVVAKVSLDDGDSWGPLQVLCDHGPTVCGNPTSLYAYGHVYLMVNTEGEDHYRRTRILELSTAGESISVDRNEDITAQVRQPGAAGWDAVGPGNGIVLAHHTPGRIVFPATQRIIFSDDQGATWRWQLVRATVPGSNVRTNESSIVELSDGRLLRSDRQNEPRTVEGWADHVYRRPQLWGSFDGDLYAWDTEYTLQDDLPVPGTRCDDCPEGARTCAACAHGLMCQAVLIRWNGTLAFVSPRSTRWRRDLALSLSSDGGASYTEVAVIQAEEAGYSAAASLASGDLGVLYERGLVRACSRDRDHSVFFRRVSH